MGAWSGCHLDYAPPQVCKTLNMDMLNCFFSPQYAGRGDLFEGLSIWEEEKYRQMQGTYPVIFLSFASVKSGEIEEMKTIVKYSITDVYQRFSDIMESERFSEAEREAFASISMKMDDATAITAINKLCYYLEKYYGKKAIVLLDEYDTPMQEAWLAGNWDETVQFFRLFSMPPSRQIFRCTGLSLQGLQGYRRNRCFLT